MSVNDIYCTTLIYFPSSIDTWQQCSIWLHTASLSLSHLSLMIGKYGTIFFCCFGKKIFPDSIYLYIYIVCTAKANAAVVTLQSWSKLEKHTQFKHMKEQQLMIDAITIGVDCQSKQVFINNIKKY